MIVTHSGWLDPSIRDESVRTSPLRTAKPICIIHHATSTKASPQALARKIRTYNRGVDRPASWHLIVSRSGEIWQSAPLTVGTWHCATPITVAGKLHLSANRVSIGIEWEHPGPVKGVWADYTDQQRAVWPELRAALRSFCGPLEEFGHLELDPKRRSDPGHDWLDWLRSCP